MMTVQEIKNVRGVPEQRDRKTWIWEQVSLLILGLTIIGQITVGAWFILGQALWCAANITAVLRNIALKRPLADCVKDGVMLAITVGIIICWALGIY
jgi:hypothetical protein